MREYSSNLTLENKKMFDAKTTLISMRSENNHKLVFDHLNINSIRNKFEFIAEHIKGNIDVLIIFETKIDNMFPLGIFLMEGFSSFYRAAHDSHEGGIVLFIREDISLNLFAIDKKLVESLFAELNPLTMA